MSKSLTAMLLGMGYNEEGKREEYLKLPFAYPGSKASSLDKILPLLPYHDSYGEAFGGSGVVLLNRHQSKLEIFNDRYSGVTDFFRVVRDPATLPVFLERIAATFHGREEFIWCKRTWKNVDDPMERAARWYYMIRFAVNGKHNTTFGRSCDPVVRLADRLHKSLPLFPAIHKRLIPVTIENLDWRMCLDDFDLPGMVWYLDPTYLDSTKGMYETELSVNDHRELMVRIPALKGFVAVSSYDTPLTREIYDVPGVWDEKIVWERKTTALSQAFTDTNNLANMDTDSGRGKVKEMLWLRKQK